jgi:uncharacterized protein
VGKLLIWLVILTMAYIAWRVYVGKQEKSARRRARGDDDHGQQGGPRGDQQDGGQDSDGASGRDKSGRLAAPESMMQCNVCGLHLPGSEALYARGRVYCSAEHRTSDSEERDDRG